MNIIKKLFYPSEEDLNKAAWHIANERFNIVDVNGIHYISYNERLVSTQEDSNSQLLPLLDRLYKYRKMFVEQYIASNGRI